MTKMAEKKMDGEARLKELGLVFTFAGYGGTNVLVGSTLQVHEPHRSQFCRGVVFDGVAVADH